MKLKKKTRSQLVKEADKWFSLAVRLRDSDEFGNAKCITCPIIKNWKTTQCGHFQSRRHYSTRWDYENCAAQEQSCNIFKQGEQYAFGIALDERFGVGTADRMIQKARTTTKLSTSDLEKIIEDAKEQVEYYVKIKKLQM